ncbi:uncharacterized protein LOC120326322 [Styela clava]
MADSPTPDQPLSTDAPTVVLDSNQTDAENQQAVAPEGQNLAEERELMPVEPSSATKTEECLPSLVPSTSTDVVPENIASTDVRIEEGETVNVAEHETSNDINKSPNEQNINETNSDSIDNQVPEPDITQSLYPSFESMEQNQKEELMNESVNANESKTKTAEGNNDSNADFLESNSTEEDIVGERLHKDEPIDTQAEPTESVTIDVNEQIVQAHVEKPPEYVEPPSEREETPESSKQHLAAENSGDNADQDTEIQEQPASESSPSVAQQEQETEPSESDEIRIRVDYEMKPLQDLTREEMETVMLKNIKKRRQWVIVATLLGVCALALACTTAVLAFNLSEVKDACGDPNNF